MNGEKWEICDTLYRSPSGVPLEGNTRKFTADGGGAFFDFSFTVKRRNSPVVVESLVVSAIPSFFPHHTHRIEILLDPDDDSRIVAKRFSLSQTVLHHIDCFILQARADEPNSPTREMTSHEVPP